jgi:histone demethylase JARID1
MACHGQHDQDLMVTCDECENSCHLSCVIPPLKSIPQEEWYCMPCIENTGKDFGFEDSDERTLAQFQALASEFKKDHFQALGGHSLQNLTELDTEKEFWRLVESLEDIEVEYGADIHSTLHGR